MTPAQGFILMVCLLEAGATTSYALAADWRNATIWMCWTISGATLGFWSQPS